MPGVWTNQCSKYTKVLNMPLVLNLPGFWICQGHTGFWICMNIPEYAWLCLAEYAGICVNMPNSAWMVFVLCFPIVTHCLLEGVVTYFYVYTKLEVLVWRKIEVVSLEKQNLIFSIVAVSILFGFCFRLSIFTSKISNFLLSLGAEGGGACESWCTFFYFTFTCSFCTQT